jgi:hypothetical protein
MTWPPIFSVPALSDSPPIIPDLDLSISMAGAGASMGLADLAFLGAVAAGAVFLSLVPYSEP